MSYRLSKICHALFNALSYAIRVYLQSDSIDAAIISSSLSLVFLLQLVSCRQRVKDTGSVVKDKTQSLRAVRKLKRFDKNFKRAAFAQQAHDIYVEAHQLLQE